MVATASPRASRTQGRPFSQTPPPVETPILFQKYFKSVGPRTYAAQVKRARNGNHFLVLTVGQRHPQTNELKKSRLLVFGEDFVAFFRLLHDMAVFVRDNPRPPRGPEGAGRVLESAFATQLAAAR